MREDGSVQLRAASPVEHVLARDATAPRFTDRLVLDGESAVSETGATFKECVTGVTFAVADAGVYRELRRQHRRMNARGRPQTVQRWYPRTPNFGVLLAFAMSDFLAMVSPPRAYEAKGMPRSSSRRFDSSSDFAVVTMLTSSPRRRSILS